MKHYLIVRMKGEKKEKEKRTRKGRCLNDKRQCVKKRVCKGVMEKEINTHIYIHKK